MKGEKRNKETENQRKKTGNNEEEKKKKEKKDKVSMVGCLGFLTVHENGQHDDNDDVQNESLRLLPSSTKMK